MATELPKAETMGSAIYRTLVLSFIIFPILMSLCVGAYGLVVWMLQMFVIGLPSA